MKMAPNFVLFYFAFLFPDVLYNARGSVSLCVSSPLMSFNDVNLLFSSLASSRSLVIFVKQIFCPLGI